MGTGPCDLDPDSLSFPWYTLVPVELEGRDLWR